jgi:proteasome lid subunit RPN8/RPN11
MAIEISVLDIEAIRSHGEETFPNECCGFILGKANGDLRNVAELMRAENDREDEAKYNRFLITPDAFMRGEKTAREKGLDIIGFYHSHPDAPARPSQYDLDHAWPWYSYVIVSIKAGKSDVMTSWVLREDRGAFGEEDIIELS